MSAGHRTSVLDSFGGETDSVYNAQGKLASESYRKDGQVIERIDQTYNAAGEVTHQTRYSDNGTTVVATREEKGSA